MDPQTPRDPETLDPARFREAIACFATGVTVITTVHEGKPAGMTASAVSSVSLDPVLLLVCVDNRLATHTALEGSRRFVVNVLGEGQEPLAKRFASKGAEKFTGVPLREDSELPVLDEAIAHFECDVHERFPGGDHSIFIGRVRECSWQPGARPLVYYRSGFGKFEDPTAEHALDHASGVGMLSGLPLPP
jgi:flavin reductase (DIM6/NTAB) family NADH-FMN oxidoreductase RutF